MTISNERVDAIVQQLVVEFQAHTIYLFGSRARKLEREDSDLDLAFLSESKHDPIQLFYMSQTLADIAGCEVDLIDLSSANTVLQSQIIAYGRCIYAENLYKKNLYDIKILKEYALLNEERTPIIEKIKEREGDYGS